MDDAMTTITEQQLLAELRSLRAAHTETRTETLRRLDSIESALVGRIDADGPPGLLARVPDIDGRLNAVEARAEWMHRTLIRAIVSGVVTMIASLVTAVLIATS